MSLNPTVLSRAHQLPAENVLAAFAKAYGATGFELNEDHEICVMEPYED
jgi:hypothetical protein